MTNMKSTKRALLMSIASLFLCFTMLLGTTFAWFTDEATSSGNKIVAGTLDVKLLMDANGAGYENIGDLKTPIFGNEESLIAQNNNADTLWEPGKTQVAYLAIQNAGNLDLKYTVSVEVKNVTENLNEVMEYKIIPDAKYGDVTAWGTDAGVKVVLGSNVATAEPVSLNATESNDKLANSTHYFALALHMNEEAGNQYMNGTIEFDVKVIAGQLSSENDSFDNLYDFGSALPWQGGAVLEEGASAVEVEITKGEGVNETNVGSAIVPAGAIDNDKKVNVIINETAYQPSITVEAGRETKTYDVKVTGLKANNDVPVKVSLRIAAGLDPETVKLYHYNDEIPCSYNPNTGYVTFQSATFSPFTIVYDAESKYTPPVVDENSTLPVANVVASPEYVNTELPWGSYGAWSPTADLDSKLEAAYTFKCTETADEAALNPYANWYCDFYVMLDRALGENQLFLGGNYGSFGWVGFHNGDVTLEANTELGLLESVTTNPWTYYDVANYVGEFICGVGDVNDALADATFTVMLRLTNPDDANDFVNIAKITHTFTKTVTNGEELQNAIDNGTQNITLGNDIDLSQGLIFN